MTALAIIEDLECRLIADAQVAGEIDHLARCLEEIKDLATKLGG